MKFTPTLILSFCAALAFVSRAEAQTELAGYNFGAGTAASSVASGLTASPVTFGPHLIANSIGRSGAGNLFFAGAAVTQTDAGNGYGTWATSSADAFGKDHYAAFTLTAEEGKVLSISGLSLRFGGSDNSGVGTFTSHVEVRSSLDNYESVLKTQAYNVQAGANTSNTPASFSLSLAAVSDFQNVVWPVSVTFRIYVWADNYSGDTTGTAAANTIRLDDFVVSGALTAIPEPASAGLGMAGVGLVLAASRHLRRPVRR